MLPVDDASVRALVHALLTSLGYEVETAVDGEAVPALIDEGTFTALIGADAITAAAVRGPTL